MRRALLILTLLLIPWAVAHSTDGVGHGDEILFRPRIPVIGEPTTIDIMVKNASGEPQLTLDLVHERAMHVFIVGSDLTRFAHIHPEDIPDGFVFQWIGSYAVRTVFPAAGEYLIVADYTVGGITHEVSFPVNVSGEPMLATPEPDYSRTKTSGEYTVSLDTDGTIRAGKDTQLIYHIERDGEPVRDLSMYLGSEMHVLGVRSDLTNPFHMHAYRPGHALHTGAMPQRYVGPDVPVHVMFPTPGIYAVFNQFNASGEIVTARFLVKVQPDHTDGKGNNELLVVGALVVLVIGYFVWCRRPRRKK